MRRPTLISELGGHSRVRLCRVSASVEFEDNTVTVAQLQDLLLASETIEDFLAALATLISAYNDWSCSVDVGPIGGRPYAVAGSDDLARELAELQNESGHGPAVQATESKQPVFIIEMADESRWPEYSTAALAAGIRSVMAYPLTDQGRVLGVLSLQSRVAQAPSDTTRATLASLAQLVAGALALALRLAGRDELIRNLRVALNTRSSIDTAIGILMGQQRCDAKTAFALLRATSQRRNLKLRDVAAQVVAGLERDVPGAPTGRY
jgi:GAF domain-containing protein